MFYSLTGMLHLEPPHTVVCAIEGVCYEISVPSINAFSNQQKGTIYTYMHYNQEQGPSLYGFSSKFEKTMFLSIISCSGIGPKLALTMLEHMAAQDLINIIMSHDQKALSSIPGIGAKKAEQLIVSLKHKFEKLLATGITVENPSTNLKVWQELSQALVSLNYSRNEVARALSFVKESDEKTAQFDQLLRKALSYLSKPTI
jgi:holliday junction DNA helicase RuvA